MYFGRNDHSEAFKNPLKLICYIKKGAIGFPIDNRLYRKQKHSGEGFRVTWFPYTPSICLRMCTEWLTGSVYFNCVTSHVLANIYYDDKHFLGNKLGQVVTQTYL